MLEKRHQKETGAVLLEGVQIINEALAAGNPLERIFYWEDAALIDLPIGEKGVVVEKCIQVPWKYMKTISERANPQGVIAVMKKPKNIVECWNMLETESIKNTLKSLLKLKSGRLPIILVCDRIRDAGNMGSLLRAAAATNCMGVFVLAQSVDIYDSVTLRAGAGAHFRLPIATGLSWTKIADGLNAFEEERKALIKNAEEGAEEEGTTSSKLPKPLLAPPWRITVASAAHAQQSSVLAHLPHYDVYSYDWTAQPTLLVLGNESIGAGQGALQLADQQKGN